MDPQSDALPPELSDHLHKCTLVEITVPSDNNLQKARKEKEKSISRQHQMNKTSFKDEKPGGRKIGGRGKTFSCYLVT